MQHNLISAITFAHTACSTTYLYKNLWKQDSTALLHAPRTVDKTKPVLDIINEIVSLGEKVVYVDTQCHLADHCSRIASMDKLFILRPRYESPDDQTDYADIVINAIEEAIRTADIRVFVVDSVTRIAALSFGRNASAAYVMKRLVALQVRYNISLLVISHDTTRATDRALINLADSEITLDPEADSRIVESQPVATIVKENHSNTPTSDSTRPHSKMTRQQRRALEREAAKLARKNDILIA